MTRATESASTFLEKTNCTDILDVEGDLTARVYEELEIINEMMAFASKGTTFQLIRINSGQKPVQQYAKWQAFHIFLSERPDLEARYYEAHASTRFAGGDVYISEQIRAGERHPSEDHIWEFSMVDPVSSAAFRVIHLAGAEGEGWEYSVLMTK